MIDLTRHDDDYAESEFTIGECSCHDCTTGGAWSYAHGHDHPGCRFTADKRTARNRMERCSRCAA